MGVGVVGGVDVGVGVRVRVRVRVTSVAREHPLRGRVRSEHVPELSGPLGQLGQSLGDELGEG